MHYQDDYYHPNAADYDDGYESDGTNTYSEPSIDSSADTDRRRIRKLWEDSKLADKGCHTFSRWNGTKKMKITAYGSSNAPGYMIRDAITGTYMHEYRVGSRSEHQLFKVTFATGECGNNAVNFFFDSPEQYERHFNGSVSSEIKEKWVNKCILERKLATIREGGVQPESNVTIVK